jgi:hypothetical protein
MNYKPWLIGAGVLGGGFVLLRALANGSSSEPEAEQVSAPFLMFSPSTLPSGVSMSQEPGDLFPAAVTGVGEVERIAAQKEVALADIAFQADSAVMQKELAEKTLANQLAIAGISAQTVKDQLNAMLKSQSLSLFEGALKPAYGGASSQVDITDPYGGSFTVKATSNQAPETSRAGQIKAAWNALLGRDIDNATLNYLSSTGKSISEINSAITRSAEYASTHGGNIVGTEGQIVDAFRRTIGTDPTAGLLNWAKSSGLTGAALENQLRSMVAEQTTTANLGKKLDKSELAQYQAAPGGTVWKEGGAWYGRMTTQAAATGQAAIQRISQAVGATDYSPAIKAVTQLV